MASVDLLFGEVPASSPHLLFGDTLVSALRAWLGSEWASGTLQRWNGSAWVPAPLLRWNGSAWE